MRDKVACYFSLLVFVLFYGTSYYLMISVLLEKIGVCSILSNVNYQNLTGDKYFYLIIGNLVLLTYVAVRFTGLFFYKVNKIDNEIELNKEAQL